MAREELSPEQLQDLVADQPLTRGDLVCALVALSDAMHASARELPANTPGAQVLFRQAHGYSSAGEALAHHWNVALPAATAGMPLPEPKTKRGR